MIRIAPKESCFISRPPSPACEPRVEPGTLQPCLGVEPPLTYKEIIAKTFALPQSRNNASQGMHRLVEPVHALACAIHTEPVLRVAELLSDLLLRLVIGVQDI